MRLYGFVIGLAVDLMGVARPVANLLMTSTAGRFIRRSRLFGVGGADFDPARSATSMRLPAAALSGCHRAASSIAIGFVSLIGAVLVMPTTCSRAVGVRAAHAMSKRSLEVAFGCYLSLLAAFS